MEDQELAKRLYKALDYLDDNQLVMLSVIMTQPYCNPLYTTRFYLVLKAIQQIKRSV